MSEAPKDGGPAFPQLLYADSLDAGMSLRDYFAGQALVALPHLGCGADLDTKDTAAAAYQLADAMLRERSKQ